MNKVLELILLADVQSVLGWVSFALIEDADEPRLHITAAVELQEAVVEQSGEALRKLCERGVDGLLLLQLQVRRLVDGQAVHKVSIAASL